jgi:hypothetical protein
VRNKHAPIRGKCSVIPGLVLACGISLPQGTGRRWCLSPRCRCFASVQPLMTTLCGLITALANYYAPSKSCSLLIQFDLSMAGGQRCRTVPDTAAIGARLGLGWIVDERQTFQWRYLALQLRPLSSCSLIYCSIHSVHDRKRHYCFCSNPSLGARKRKLRGDDLASLRLYPLDGLLSLVVDYSLLLEVLHL